MLLAAAVLLVFLFQALATPPSGRYDAVLERQAEALKEKDPRASMRALWYRAEQLYRAGRWEEAEAAYRRIIDEYPYTEIDYGFRTDDARQRIREIEARKRGERIGSPLPGY